MGLPFLICPPAYVRGHSHIRRPPRRPRARRTVQNRGYVTERPGVRRRPISDFRTLGKSVRPRPVLPIRSGRTRTQPDLKTGAFHFYRFRLAFPVRGDAHRYANDLHHARVFGRAPARANVLRHCPQGVERHRSPGSRAASRQASEQNLRGRPAVLRSNRSPHCWQWPRPHETYCRFVIVSRLSMRIISSTRCRLARQWRSSF
jgi:hypothetical protein